MFPSTPASTSHIRCEPIFNNTFGDKPRCIDPATTLRITTHNGKGIKTFTNDSKLQSGIGNMVSLQSGITCLTETNVEWRNYGFRQAYKDAFTKYYQSSRHVFSSSSEVYQSSYHKRGGTVTSATYRWMHIVHKSGEYSTGAGLWSFITMIGKYNTLIFITCYLVCPQPPQSCLGSAYYQQERIMEDEMESIPFSIDPHIRTIQDLQIFIASYQQEGYLVFLFMDGNQEDLHVFREQKYDGKCCTPLGFHYDKTIDGSIVSMVDACDLVNIHKYKHVNTPPTQTYGSTKKDFIFMSSEAAELIFRCGILDFNNLFSSYHRSLYIDIDILRLLGYPVHGTI
jgi:hypothetical protein